MADEKPPRQLGARRVGPPVLLGQRSRFIPRAVETAHEDERIRALLLWGSLARGDADEWSDIDFIALVRDESVADLLDDLGQKDTPYGQSLISVQMLAGVEGGACLSVTYLQSGLPLHVDWYICPTSLGMPVGDTKPLFTRERWANSGTSFAELLRDRPGRQTLSPLPGDVNASTIPIDVKQVVRGRPDVVLVDGKPLNDQIAAYDELGWRIAALPGEYSDIRPPLFNHLGLARSCR